MSSSFKLNGVEYPLVWGNLAMFRFRSIPFAQRGVVGPGQLAQLIWSAYKGVQHPFPTWEHVLAAIADLSSAEYEAIDVAMAAALPAVEETAKADAKDAKPEPESSPAEKKSNSTVNEPSPGGGSD